MTPLRLVLISPKGPLYRFDGGIWRTSLRYAPLTLTTLAALVPEDVPCEITCHDESAEKLPDTIDADLVGMTVITGSANRAYQLAAGFRARGIPVVLGGPHVTLVPEEAGTHADAVVVGYAEESWPRLLRDFVRGALDRVYRQTPRHDLAGVPPPRRELLQGKRFLPMLTVEATRGCCHDCDFCVVPSAWGRRPYLRPVDEVVAEIRAGGRRDVLFLDLNLIADPDHAAKLFAALVPLRIRWGGLATTLFARRPELVELAAKSGCGGLLLGFESLTDEGLADAAKGFNAPGAYRGCIELLHRHGIAVQGCFVFGLDHDEVGVCERVADFCIDARIDLPRFTVVTPFPGTPLFARLEAEGRILSTDWDRYDGQHVVYRPMRMSPEELQDGLVRAWRKAYTLGAMWRRLGAVKRRLPLMVAANLGYRFYGRRLAKLLAAGGTPAAPEATACA